MVQFVTGYAVTSSQCYYTGYAVNKFVTGYAVTSSQCYYTGYAVNKFSMLLYWISAKQILNVIILDMR